VSSPDASSVRPIGFFIYFGSLESRTVGVLAFSLFACQSHSSRCRSGLRSLSIYLANAVAKPSAPSGLPAPWHHQPVRHNCLLLTIRTLVGLGILRRLAFSCLDSVIGS
jgi:hypothetical protein